MKKIMFFLLVFYFASGCIENDKYYYIPSNMKPDILSGVTVCYFDSANQATDSFIVNTSSHFAHLDSHEVENITVNYSFSNRHRTFKKFYIYYEINGTSTYIDNHHFTGSSTYTVKNDMTIQGKVYPTVYVLHDSYFPDSIPQTVYYTYKNGIIRYEYKDGRKYELINN